MSESSEMRCAAQNSRIDMASGGPRIGGFVALALHCGSLCAIGSTAPGSALGGPGLRLVGSAVTIGLRPVTSPRAIAITPLKPDGAQSVLSSALLATGLCTIAASQAHREISRDGATA